jgi:hypothetical protein
MSAWALFVDVVGLVFTAPLLLALRWATIERGHIHREWARQRALGRKVVQPIDWYMAMAVAAGCA